MDPNQNTGSFGAAIGGSQALKDAMARRGVDAGTLQQVSPASAGGAAPIPQTPETEAASAALQPSAPMQEAPDSDVTIAMKALSTVVTNDSKMKRDLIALRGQGGAI